MPRVFFPPLLRPSAPSPPPCCCHRHCCCTASAVTVDADEIGDGAVMVCTVACVWMWIPCPELMSVTIRTQPNSTACSRRFQTASSPEQVRALKEQPLMNCCWKLSEWIKLTVSYSTYTGQMESVENEKSKSFEKCGLNIWLALGLNHMRLC